MLGGGYEGQQMAFSDENQQTSTPLESSSGIGRSKIKCDRKCCSVGRNHAKQSSWFRQKIHFVDVSKLRHPKLCMKTTLVGDDCKPLLIQAGEDVTVPLANQVTNEEQGNKKHQNSPNNKGHCGKCGLLLDALARTFCLPLLGWSLMVDRWRVCCKRGLLFKNCSSSVLLLSFYLLFECTSKICVDFYEQKYTLLVNEFCHWASLLCLWQQDFIQKQKRIWEHQSL